MKTKLFLLVTAVAAVLTILSSCEKDDGSYVIDSEVLEAGCDEEIKQSSLPDGLDGICLSYESWIMVRLQTRAISEEKIRIPLNARFPSIKKDIDVKSLELVQVETSSSFKAGDVKKNGYVTVVDSILVFKQAYETFSFEYEFVYQVPIYDDGIVKQAMPYYRIEKFEDKGVVLGKSEISKDGKYLTRPYQHSIIIHFGGNQYEAKSNFLLKQEMVPGQDYLLSSEVVAEGTTWSNSNTEYESWLDLKQSWSKSGDVNIRKKRSLRVSLIAPSMPYSLLWDKNISFMKLQVDQVRENTVVIGDVISVKEYQNDYLVKYNYFDMKFSTTHQEAFYDDGFVSRLMPSFNPETDFVVEDYKIKDARKDILVDGIAADEYDFLQPIFLSIGDKKIKEETFKVIFVRR